MKLCFCFIAKYLNLQMLLDRYDIKFQAEFLVTQEEKKNTVSD